MPIWREHRDRRRTPAVAEVLAVVSGSRPVCEKEGMRSFHSSGLRQRMKRAPCRKRKTEIAVTRLCKTSSEDGP